MVPLYMGTFPECGFSSSNQETNDYGRKKGRGLQLPSFFAGEARSEGRAAVNGNDSSRRRLNRSYYVQNGVAR